jgi:hypothetical protein
VHVVGRDVKVRLLPIVNDGAGDFVVIFAWEA